MKKLMQFILFLITVLRTTGATEVFYARVGDTVTLNIPKPPGNTYVQWHSDTVQSDAFAWINHMGGKNTDLPEMWKNTLLSLGSLTIIKIREEQFRTFFSKVGIQPNFSVTKFRIIKVSVDVTPASLVMPSDKMSLSCNVETPGDLGKPNIYWMDPQGNRKAGKQLTLTAESQVSGQWTCVVYDKKFQFPVSVSVAGFSPAPPLQFTSTNFPLKVLFSITPNNMVQEIIQKIVKVEWYFTPKTSSSPEILVGNSRSLTYSNFTKDGDISLFRKQAKNDDSGNYTCSITFLNNFHLISSVQVEVLQIVPSPRTELISGNQLNLSCTTGGQLLPGMQVKWYHPKTVHRKTAGPRSDLFVIPKLSTADSGTWRCELLQNQTRLTSAEITLKIDPILSVWMLVTICSAGVILILLLVVASILYRRRQRRMRHLRHRLCHCTNPKPKGFYKN
ncbi:CD4-1 molecule [Kryptolebias marmoratus]|uniref:Uncharacterized LOC108235418 n=1 Tax=Kryptolebias marmoratus TaxID=37003 RepID=A0A3Q3AK91_KRYMA|nr:CD4-1 molecule [Kryptolebias marmoratus]